MIECARCAAPTPTESAVWCDVHGYVCPACLTIEEHGVSCFVD